VLLWPLHTEDPSQTAAGWLSPIQDPPLDHRSTCTFLSPLLAGGKFLPANALKGPRLVSGDPGGAVTIQCHYTPLSVNRHQRKYWCRLGPPRWICYTIVSSSHYTHHRYQGRVALADFPQSGLFVVRLSQLSLDDAGYYRCGIGDRNDMLFFSMNLTVSAGPELTNDTEVYTVDLGGSVTIVCPFNRENAEKKKSLCKKTGEDCEIVIDSNNYVNPNYSDRASLLIQGTSQLVFSVVIDRLRLSDAGLYVCQAGDDSSGDTKNADLQVLKPEPELVYGDLGGSVTFDCAPGTEEADVAQFLCRASSGDTCDVVINTLGTRASGFEGRILLNTTEKNGLFSVLITGLRKEDAGRYLCGAHPEGLLQEGWPIQEWQLFVNEETMIPRSSSVVKGVAGGSVAVLCSYNPKEDNSLKYWCRWEGTQNGQCSLLVQSEGLVQEQYEGRLALSEEPGNGTYTVILNQLTTQDAGFYWCLTNGDNRWRTVKELKIVEGKPNLKVPENVTAVLGETLKLPCHFPCKFYSHEKYWCKWSNQGCQVLPSQDEGPSQAFVNCDQSSRLISLTLSSVSRADEGWYWCGVKRGHFYGETAAVYVAVEENKSCGSSSVSLMNANTVANEVVESIVRGIENKAMQNPRLFAEERVVEDAADQASGSRASSDLGSSEGQGRSSRVLVSTLVPLGLVLALGVVAVGVARARHRKNVDRLSIRSYRTDMSMSDLRNSRDFGANDNMGASPDTQETSLAGKDEFVATTESTMEIKEPKKAKRSSKEDAEMAYTAFLLQSNSVATEVQDGPRDA
ncbi:PREDICTED: polymeric immunoglobulin receptor, partial [Galeopterus variegatus]|uniref:polymeric immunoglobulin receptor n=1 Tax=Galeopterus variegatus TaxID=482537 RepID=UPI0004D045A0